jgi:hypothetical protein
MKAYRNLLAGGAALAALAVGSAQAATLHCDITDNRGNAMSYTFTEALDDQKALAEVSYSRNGALTMNDKTRSPLWTVVINDNENTMSLWSRVDRGWVLAFFTNRSPNFGSATLFHNNHSVGSGHCQLVDEPTEARNPTPAPHKWDTGSNDSAPISSENGGSAYKVAVDLGTFTAKMLIDTGANGMSVEKGLADALIAKGEAHAIEPGEVQLADGQTVTEERIVIDTLSVGGRTLNNVPAGIVPDGGMMLLPFPVLNQLGSFTIDTIDNRLVFGRPVA